MIVVDEFELQKEFNIDSDRTDHEGKTIFIPMNQRTTLRVKVKCQTEDELVSLMHEEILNIKYGNETYRMFVTSCNPSIYNQNHFVIDMEGITQDNKEAEIIK
jgi:hypothetical protein